MLGVGGVRPLQLGDGLVVDRLGLREFAVEPQQVALTLQGLAQAEDILGGGRRILLGVGQGPLGFQGLAVERVRLVLVGPAADQEVGQQGAGAGQRLLRVMPCARGDRQRPSISTALR